MRSRKIKELKKLTQAHKKYIKSVKAFEKKTDCSVCGIYDSIHLLGGDEYFDNTETNFNKYETITNENVIEQSFIFDGIKILRIKRGDKC